MTGVSPLHPATPGPRPSADVVAHYSSGDEARRLESGSGRIERARTEELLARFLPPPPAVVIDIGGAAGVYACPLAEHGYQVHLVDLVPRHVELAQAASAAARRPLASARVGDARRLDQADASCDAALLLGPLYHLLDRCDRVQALREAARALRPGGVLLAAAISRCASLLDGLSKDRFADPTLAALIDRDLRYGQRRNPTGNPLYFTDACFHRPEELADEAADAGLAVEAVLGIEGPGWLVGDLDRRWADARLREQVLLVARLLEAEPAVRGASAHLMLVARRR